MHKKIISGLSVFALCFSISMGALAAGEKASCQDLDDMAEALDELAGVIDKGAGEISEGDETDKALKELVEGLFVVADSEGESDLHDYVDQLAGAWEKMDGPKFTQALDGVAGSLDRLIKRDCMQ